jgi:NitT/TauT family transport system substrate-binding protein
MRVLWRWSILLVLLVSGCGLQAATTPGAADKVEVRLGFFPNLTHATALYGMAKGMFEASLAESNATLRSTIFNAGPDAVEALFAGALDATYIGPGPTINAFARSHGEAVRVVSGATSGGAFLVVRPGIDSPADLRGTRLATPQLGNTQDIALRAWLTDQGYHTDLQGTGDVSILPQSNAQTVESLRAGEIDGAWIPEPYATLAITSAGVHVLVDERDLWPDGRYVTTELIVRTAFLHEHPDLVSALLAAQVEANDAVNGDAAAAQQVVAQELKSISGVDIDLQILRTAWGNLVFTNDPIASSLLASATRAEQLGLLDQVSLDGLYDLDPLNEVLAAAGESPVPQP